MDEQMAERSVAQILADILVKERLNNGRTAEEILAEPEIELEAGLGIDSLARSGLSLVIDEEFDDWTLDIAGDWRTFADMVAGVEQQLQERARTEGAEPRAGDAAHI